MLIGREAEQGAVTRLVAGARVGHSGALVLTGEAGIGKTALLRHATTQAEGMQVLRAAGTEPERNVAFGGLLQLLRPLLPFLEAIPEPRAAALRVALALRSGTAGDRFAVGAATLSLLSRCSEDQPVLLLVDDAHVLDRPSAEAIVFVARRLLADRVAVLAATRDEPATPLFAADLPQLRLSGLPADDARELLQRKVRRSVAADVMARLLAATAGNPLAIVEYAGEIDRLGRIGPHTPLPAPEGVARSFAHRISELSQPTQAVLVLAAITDGDLSLVAAAAEAVGATAGALAEAEAAGLVHIATDTVEFSHPLVLSSVYASAPPSLRRTAHAAVADVLPPADVERRAWHRAESLIGPDDEVAAALHHVGDLAVARSAYDVGATAYERAALLSTQAAVHVGRVLEAGTAAWLAGQTQRAVDLLSRAAELTTDATRLAAIDAIRGSVALHAGSLEEARMRLTRAASAIAAEDPDTAVPLFADLVLAHFFLADTAGGLGVAAAIDEAVARATTDEAQILGDLMAGVAQVLAGGSGIGRIRRAVARIETAPDWTEEPRRPTWELLGPLFLRESAMGRGAIERVVEQVRDHGAVATLPTVLFYAARDDATTEHWQDAVSKYEEGIALSRETGDITALVVCLAGLAWLQARMGRVEPCRDNAAEAARLAEEHHVHLGRLWALYADGDLELASGNASAAVLRYSELDAALDELGVRDVDLSPGPDLVEALLRGGNAEQAGAVAAAHAAQARAKGQPWALARAERALGLSSEGEKQDEHFAAALAHHAETLDVYEQARTELAYGAALRPRRRRVASRPHLRAALDTFDRLGAQPWAAMAAAELDATGETPHRRGAGAGELLTPQELQIARMLAAGKSTRQAAAALFLSPKTVEYHLRHAYTKLGINSRAELSQRISGEEP